MSWRDVLRRTQVATRQRYADELIRLMEDMRRSLVHGDANELRDQKAELTVVTERIIGVCAREHHAFATWLLAMVDRLQRLVPELDRSPTLLYDTVIHLDSHLAVIATGTSAWSRRPERWKPWMAGASARR